MPQYPTFSETAHNLVKYEPADEAMGEKLDFIRGQFQNLIDNVGELVPNDANGTLAARALHQACQACILAVIKEGSNG